VAFTVTGNVVAIRWSGDGCPSTSYILHAGSAPTLSNVTIANLGPSTSVTASAPNGTYYVRLYAQNAFGSSPPSAEVVITVGGGSPRRPGNADALFDQAVILYNAGQFAEARVLLLQVIDIDPNYADAYYFLALIDLNGGNLSSALNSLRAYLKLAPTGQYATQVKELLRQLGFPVPF
jgi:tetratricopeptide (TPR) repeat protein